jgi:hypothetical protein
MSNLSILSSAIFRWLVGLKIFSHAYQRNNYAEEISHFATETFLISRFVQLTFTVHHFKVRLHYNNKISSIA